MRKLDILFVHPNASVEIYQDLSKEHSAKEPPIWAVLLSSHMRKKGFSVNILDCECEGLNYIEAAKVVKDINPKIVCLVVYGQQPSASSQNMEGATVLADEIKRIDPELKIVFVGGHVAALPHEVLSKHPSIDFVCQNEGVYTIADLLKMDDYSDYLILERIKGLGWRNEGKIVLNEINKVIPQENLEEELPGDAWDLLPDFSKYRTAAWHSWTNKSIKTPFASIYTSLGCPFKCFVAGTRIITSNTTNKKIEEISVGDKLIGYDENTGKLVETTVHRLIRNTESKTLLKIKFENNRHVTCTEEHPFYIHGKWIEAKNLKIGDEIHSIKFNDKISFNKKLYNPVLKKECRDKISKKVKEHHKSGKLKNNFKDKDWHKKYPSYSKNPELKEINYKIQSKRMKIDNPMYRKEILEKVTNTKKNQMESGEWIPYMKTQEYWDKLKKSPNKLELKFNEFLETNFSGEWKFTGNGSNRIQYYAPDFTGVNKKNKLIELNGCYWHNCIMCHPGKNGNQNKRDKHRLKTFEINGFKCLEVWEHELKDLVKLSKKIGDFLYNGLKIKSIERIQVEKPVDVYNFECKPYSNYFVGLSRNSGDYILSHNCDFCMINIINREDNSPDVASDKSSKFRYWSPQHTIKQFDYFASKGVKNVKIADELFVLRENHFMEICKLIIERKYDFNIWCYSRVDTCKPHQLEMLKKAGVNFIGLGIESPNQVVRKDVVKGGYKDVKILDIIKMLKDHGIGVGANYIFGLPEDNETTMKETFDFAMSNLTENFNLYCAMAYPGSPLHLRAKQSGIKLPDRYSGYSQHSYWTQNMSSNYLPAEEILRYRDKCWMEYFTNPSYLQMMKNLYGQECVDSINSTTKIKLKRKLLGD